MSGMNNDPLAGLESDNVEPFAVTPGFIAFIAMLVLPVILVLAVYTGAAAVASDVYAADRAEAAAATQPAASAPASARAASPQADVAGWKRTLVGVCPLH